MIEKEPAEAFWEAVVEWDLSKVDAEHLIGSVESIIRRPLIGVERADLLSLAEGEIKFFNEENTGEV